MKETIPTPAVFAGSLARTFEYRTTGVSQSPQVRWTWAAPGRITCPVLVDQGMIYLADNQGSFSALEAASGRVLWTFQAEHGESQDGATGITAMCLAGDLGYVAVAQGLLCEIDLKTGECVHSWDLVQIAEGENIDPFGLDEIQALLLLDEQLLILTGERIWHLNRARKQLSVVIHTFIVSGGKWLPGVYRTPEGKHILFNFDFINRDEDSSFGATMLADRTMDASGDSDAVLWYVDDSSGTCKPPDLELYDLSYRMMPLIDDVLYVFSNSPAPLPDEEEGEEEEEGDEGENSLLAVNPLTGTRHWSIPFPDHEVSQLAAVSSLIFLRFDNHIEAFSTQTHKQLWSWNAGATTSHCFVADTLLYLLDEQGQIIALDIHTGEERWHWRMEGAMLEQWLQSAGRRWASQICFSTIASGTLYVVAGGTLYALS